MRRRGRPPHPDILTPREWEVLALLREGLSNEDVAERLGISRDGAKYHVSEILSKLGVDHRREAAAWQPERARRWWQAAIAPLAWPFHRLARSSLAGRLAIGGAAIATAGALAALAWGVCGEGHDRGKRGSGGQAKQAAC